MSKTFDYQGFHATADILLKSYPEDIVSIVRDSIKYSKLNIVAEKIHDFGGAVTGVWVLSESHYSLHEYPEHNYITVDCYTCGEEGDPLAAIENLIKTLDALVGVKDFKINELDRGNFDKSTLSMIEKAFWNTPVSEVNEMQEKMDKIAKSLNPEQLKMLDEVITWVANEQSCDDSYNNEMFESD